MKYFMYKSFPSHVKFTKSNVFSNVGYRFSLFFALQKIIKIDNNIYKNIIILYKW
jgi:hypothetical protein